MYILQYNVFRGKFNILDYNYLIPNNLQTAFKVLH